MVDIPDRNRGTNKGFLFAIDHCFQIKGQGTVITGTVLSGKTKVGDTIELPALKQEKKIKSMQMFRKPVSEVKQGDRVGICLAQLDASLIERGIAAKPGSLKASDFAILIVRRVPYYVGEVKTKAKLHISIGHQTTIGVVTFFSCIETEADTSSHQFNKNSLKTVDSVIEFNNKTQYQYEDLLPKRTKQTEETKEQT